MKPSEKLRRLFMIGSMSLLLLTAADVRKITGNEEKIVINEVCAHNASIMEQSLYGSCDYIELYNAGEVSVNLKGYGLSDKRGSTAEFVFEDYELASGARVVVFASGEVPETEEHIFADFCISDDETIYLTDNAGEIIDYVEMIPTVADIVYAREEDGAEKWATMKGSPWARNDSARKVLVPGTKVAEPTVSAESGFYRNGFLLTMQAEKDCRIYYTLDGSEPYLDDKIYEEAIKVEDASGQDNVYCSRDDLSQYEYDIPSEKVDKAVVVRAVAVDQKGRASRTITNVYFVGERFEKYKNWNIVALTADPDDLFGYENGIYVLGERNAEYHVKLENGGEELKIEPANYMLSGKYTRRDANLIIFNRECESETHQDVGIHISGNVSRAGVKKSFRAAANTKYENDNIYYAPFKEIRYPRTLVLRSGYGKNQWIQELAEESAVAVQASQPCILFLNGEYWGTYCIQERCSEEYIENFTGIPAEQIILVKGEEVTADPLEEGYESCQQEWNSLQEQIQEWYESGEDCYTEIVQKIDIQSYMDYIGIQTYVDNWDFSNRHNVALWKSATKADQGYGDGRWRWIFYDLDYTMVDFRRDTFKEPGTTEYTVAADPLFVTLMRSERFRRDFLEQYHVIAEEMFSYEKVSKYMETIQEKYQLEEADECMEFIKNRKQYAYSALNDLFE